MAEKNSVSTTNNGYSSVTSSYKSFITMQCNKLLSSNGNKNASSNSQDVVLDHIRELLAKSNLTFKNLEDCQSRIHEIAAQNGLNSTIGTDLKSYSVPKHSHSLIIFIILIAFLSLISIIGNLCLAKVLYSKRFRLIQTDRIVLCLALSELCLVLIDTPAEIYRFLSYSFTQEWLCRFHTFFESLFSSCIVFYHLLGAFDRFVYIHGHTSSTVSTWSKWCRHISTKSGSIILLFLPIICSLPLAICNCLHADIVHVPFAKKSCVVQYTHEILISLLISFYIIPILLSFFLHGKLIYFIRSKHNQQYLTKTTYILPMKRNNTIESQLKKRSHQTNLALHHPLLLSAKTSSSYRRVFLINTETIGSTTTTTTTAMQPTPFNSHQNNSSNSSQSSRSSTAASSTSITSPIILYKINSQANANAKRTVVLLVLLLSFYVCCWAPYNIYTWYNVYHLTQGSSLINRTINPTMKSVENNETSSTFPLNNNAGLRRFIYINYALYILSMISMCFSFIFYFALNKKAREEFSRFIGCTSPWVIYLRNQQRKQKITKEEQNQTRRLQYRISYKHPYSYKHERIKSTRSLSVNERYNQMKRTNYPQNIISKRTVLNYGCQIQCCP